MKNTSYSLLRIAAIFVFAVVIFSNTAYADFNDDKYMKVHIRNVVDNSGGPEFDNDSTIYYQKDDQIITENNYSETVTLCYGFNLTPIACYEVNVGETIQYDIPDNCNQYTVSVGGDQKDLILLVLHTPAPSLTTYSLILLLLLLVISTVFIMRRRASRAINL